MMKRQYPDAQIIVETCPHYLTHTVDSEWGNVGKGQPAVPRKQSDLGGTVGRHRRGLRVVVASDHVARPLAKKTGSIFSVNAGFRGCATAAPVLLEEGTRSGLSLNRIAQVRRQSRRDLWHGGRGGVKAGAVADLTVVSLDQVKEVPSSSPTRTTTSIRGRRCGWRCILL